MAVFFFAYRFIAIGADGLFVFAIGGTEDIEVAGRVLILAAVVLLELLPVPGDEEFC